MKRLVVFIIFAIAISGCGVSLVGFENMLDDVKTIFDENATFEIARSERERQGISKDILSDYITSFPIIAEEVRANNVQQIKYRTHIGYVDLYRYGNSIIAHYKTTSHSEANRALTAENLGQYMFTGQPHEPTFYVFGLSIYNQDANLFAALTNRFREDIQFNKTVSGGISRDRRYSSAKAWTGNIFRLSDSSISGIKAKVFFGLVARNLSDFKRLFNKEYSTWKKADETKLTLKNAFGGQRALSGFVTEDDIRKEDQKIASEIAKIEKPLLTSEYAAFHEKLYRDCNDIISNLNLDEKIKRELKSDLTCENDTINKTDAFYAVQLLFKYNVFSVYVPTNSRSRFNEDYIAPSSIIKYSSSPNGIGDLLITAITDRKCSHVKGNLITTTTACVVFDNNLTIYTDDIPLYTELQKVLPSIKLYLDPNREKTMRTDGRIAAVDNINSFVVEFAKLKKDSL